MRPVHKELNGLLVTIAVAATTQCASEFAKHF